MSDDMHEMVTGIGKYEREALTKRRDSLLLKRKMAHQGLSLSEAQDLDRIIQKIGEPSEPPSQRKEK